jgi:hypothetical protein
LLRERVYLGFPLWTLFVVYWIAALSSHINIGHRHLLPIYPPLFVWAGGAVAWLPRDKQGIQRGVRSAPAVARSALPAAALLLALTLYVADFLSAWPHYLAYFNHSIGGPRYAYKHLVQSSLDWGQELPGLRNWLDKNAGQQQVYLSYLGASRPEYYGIHATTLPSFPYRPPVKPPEALGRGVYCLSATMFQGVYSDYPGRWTAEYERLYQAALKAMDEVDKILADPEKRRQFGEERIKETRERLWRAYDQLRFARLCAFLHFREPDAQIGYSILIFCLDKQAIHDALHGPPPVGGPGV